MLPLISVYWSNNGVAISFVSEQLELSQIMIISNFNELLLYYNLK